LEALALDDAMVKTPPYYHGPAGDDLMDTAAELGLEGVVAKRLDSTYQPGVRSRAWIKTPLNKTAEVLIAGWRPGSGRRANLIGALSGRHGCPPWVLAGGRARSAAPGELAAGVGPGASVR